MKIIYAQFEYTPAAMASSSWITENLSFEEKNFQDLVSLNRRRLTNGVVEKIRMTASQDESVQLVTGSDVGDLPNQGSSLIVVALVDDQLTIRAFNAGGDITVDTAIEKATENSMDLKEYVRDYANVPTELEPYEVHEIIRKARDVASIPPNMGEWVDLQENVQ